jgi:hypothetical protein
MAKNGPGRRWSTAALPALLILAAQGSQALNSGQSGERANNFNLYIAVTVPIINNLKVIYQTRAITITQTDIDRGHLEVAAATRMTIANNDRSGCLLLFEGLDQPFKKALVSGLSREVQISLPAAYIHLPYTKKPASYTLSYRFDLTDDAKPGVYSWPFTFALQSNP